MESTKGVDQRYRKGATEDFLFLTVYFLKQMAESAMGFGANFIGVI